MTKILVIGHSHVATLQRAWDKNLALHEGAAVTFINLRERKRLNAPARLSFEKAKGTASRGGGIEEAALLSDVKSLAPSVDLTVLCLAGNQHNSFGLLMNVPTRAKLERSVFFQRVQEEYIGWFTLLKPHLRGPARLLMSPPPVESEARIRKVPGEYAQLMADLSIPPAPARLASWKEQWRTVAKAGEQFGFAMLDLPPDTLSADGYLAEDCWGQDPTHGNSEYGRRVLAHIIALARKLPPNEHSAVSDDHPYASLPDYAFWKQAISQLPAGAVDPVTAPPFMIRPTDKVATAGSCFAQHISKRLRAGGYKFLVTERGPGERTAAEASGYHDFSARYGNIYTSRQLLQLFDRAFGFFRPAGKSWRRRDGRYCDPFRPRIEADGFASEEAVAVDRQKHLAAVRQMFRSLNVFVFTLGLTECWASKLDGAVYPIAPGVAGGSYDPDVFEFVNLEVDDIAADLATFLRKLRLVNPDARMVLTVSPVPLVATHEDRHVLVSTTYSKSVLRVAAERTARRHEGVYYFPSYEIITGSHAGGGYFEVDRRSVTEDGVDHVMRVFMSRLTYKDKSAPPRGPAVDEAYEDMKALGEVACDEELLER